MKGQSGIVCLAKPDSAPSIDDPTFKAALREPAAFLGGVLAGLLGIDLGEEPLRGWIERTSAQAAGKEPGQ